MKLFFIFFETFLRYGNDAKELGIVFTPRHIVNFMIELIDVNPNDTVYDQPVELVVF